MTVTKENAVKVDTELAELHGKVNLIAFKLLSVEDDKKWRIKYPQYSTPSDIERLDKEIAELQSAKEAIWLEIFKLDAIYDIEPWTRAFLVQNNGGHVHKSMNCSTCFPSTQFFWLVQYSSDEESTIVEDAGEEACTICYPTAPAEVLNRPSRIVTADKIAKEEARAERQAKKEIKDAKAKEVAPTLSGEPLRIPNGRVYRGYDQYDEFRTERSAITEWYNCYGHKKSNPEEYERVAVRIAQSLAEKHGVSVEEKTAELIEKYGKRRVQ